MCGDELTNESGCFWGLDLEVIEPSPNGLEAQILVVVEVRSGHGYVSLLNLQFRGSSAVDIPVVFVDGSNVASPGGDSKVLLIGKLNCDYKNLYVRERNRRDRLQELGLSVFAAREGTVRFGS